jgi:hypothetical protein
MFAPWLRPMSKPKGGWRRPARQHPSMKLLLERCEERTVPSFAVTNYAAGTAPAAGNLEKISENWT